MQTMKPRLRKLALTAHVTFSVGWLGAVAAFLVLSIAGLTIRDAEEVRAAYLAMELMGRFIIVPLSLAALATGLGMSLGTEWGLVRYYWVLVKFCLSIVATVALMLHQFTAVAGAARRVSGTAPGTFPDVGRLGTQLVLDAGLALVVLLVITALSVFKPWGRTRYGRRMKQQVRHERASLMSVSPTVALGYQESPQMLEATSTSHPESEATANILPLGLKIFFWIIGAIALGFVVLHLASGGVGKQGH